MIAGCILDQAARGLFFVGYLYLFAGRLVLGLSLYPAYQLWPVCGAGSLKKEKGRSSLPVPDLEPADVLFGRAPLAFF